MIIVDLRTHQVVDVPPDRTADTSANWMAKHPEIELSRAEIEEEIMPMLPGKRFQRLRRRQIVSIC